MLPDALEQPVFHAIADPTRRHLMQQLTAGDRSIAALVEGLPISRTAVKKHLQVLADAGLVVPYKHGRETRYHLHVEPLAAVKSWVSFFEIYWDDKLAALARWVESEDS